MPLPDEALPATDGFAAAAGQQAADRTTRDHAVRIRRDRTTVIISRGLIVLVLLAAWQIASGPLVDSFFISKPTEIADAFVRLVVSGRFWPNVWLTLQEAFLGYLIGAGLGIAGSILLGSSSRMLAIFEPFLLIVFATPAVALAPLVIIWLGLGIAPKIFLAAYFVFLIVFLNGVSGVRTIPAGWLQMARIMGASRPQIFGRIILRAAIPHLSTGLRTSIPQAMVGALVGEFISARRGLGFLIAEATGRFDTAAALAGVATICIIVLAMFLLLQAGNDVVSRGDI